MSTGSVSPPQLWKIKKNDSDVPSPPLSLQLLQASKVSVLNLDVQPPQENEVTLEVSARRRMEAIQCYTLSKNVPFLLLHRWFLLGKRTAHVFFPPVVQFLLKMMKKTWFVWRNLTEPAVTHNYMMKSCLDFFFSSWSGGNEKKISRKRLRGCCPKTGRRPAVIGGHPWRSGSPPSGSQAHGEAPRSHFRLDQWTAIVLRADGKQTVPGQCSISGSKCRNGSNK